jgi:Lar family restriction alleviation protein
MGQALKTTLHNCPFCGSSHLFVRQHLSSYAISCQSCKAGGPHRPTYEQALSDWNRATQKLEHNSSNLSSNTESQSPEYIADMAQALEQLARLRDKHPGKLLS